MQNRTNFSGNSHLLLYGDTVFLAGIKTELEHDESLNFITVTVDNTSVLDVVRQYSPCTLLFDLTLGQLDFVVSLLRVQPDLLLIGVDPSRDDLLVLSSQSAKSLNYLINLICCYNDRQRIQIGEVQNIHG